jgi:hypothetical protein
MGGCSCRPQQFSTAADDHLQIVVIGVGKPERDDDVEIPSGVLGGFIASSSPEGGFDERRIGRHDGGT